MPSEQQRLDALSTERLRADLKGRSVRGGLVAVTSRGCQFVINTVMTVVLARLLTPTDFGLVAMVFAVTELAQAFADVGLSAATIQREDISHDQVSALFWINAAAGLGLMLVTIALGPVLAWFYKEPRVTHIAFALSATLFICALRVQPEAILRRQMRFTALAIRNIAGSILGVCVAISMAVGGAGYWALVAFPLTANFTQMALSWAAVRWMPSLPRRGTEVRSLVAFGAHVAASHLASRLSQSANNSLVGWWWGAGPLGLYSRASNLLLVPVQQFSDPIGTVVVPAFSRIQSDPERFARYYLRTVNLIMWITAPIFGFLFVASKQVILLVLGRQWMEAAPVFQILAIAALTQPLLQLTTWTLVSRGESRQLLKLRMIISPIIIGSYVIGLPFGIKAVALSASLVLLAIFPWVLSFSFHGTRLTLAHVRRAISWPLSLTLGGVGLAEVIRYFVAPPRIIPQLGVIAVSFAAAYSLSLLIPAVRKEVASVTKLFGELRLTGQAA